MPTSAAAAGARHAHCIQFNTAFHFPTSGPVHSGSCSRLDHPQEEGQACCREGKPSRGGVRVSSPGAAATVVASAGGWRWSSRDPAALGCAAALQEAPECVWQAAQRSQRTKPTRASGHHGPSERLAGPSSTLGRSGSRLAGSIGHKPGKLPNARLGALQGRSQPAGAGRLCSHVLLTSGWAPRWALDE